MRDLLFYITQRRHQKIYENRAYLCLRTYYVSALLQGQEKLATFMCPFLFHIANKYKVGQSLKEGKIQLNKTNVERLHYKCGELEGKRIQCLDVYRNVRSMRHGECFTNWQRNGGVHTSPKE